MTVFADGFGIEIKNADFAGNGVKQGVVSVLLGKECTCFLHVHAYYFALGLLLSLWQRLPFFSVTDNKCFYLITIALCCTGEHKIHFIPGMIGPFLGVTLVPQPEVRNIMIPIFHDMMDWEQRKNGNFKQVK